MYRLLSSRSLCTVHMRYYFRFLSNISNNVKKLFWEHYQLIDVYRNPLCAIISRKKSVEKHEPRLSSFRIVQRLS